MDQLASLTEAALLGSLRSSLFCSDLCELVQLSPQLLDWEQQELVTRGKEERAGPFFLGCSESGFIAHITSQQYKNK